MIVADTTYKCARALYKDQFADFALGMAGGVDLTTTFKGLAIPAHLTIVPFLGGAPLPDGSCKLVGNFNPDGARNLAVFLTNSPPAAGACDVSKNAVEQCVNEPRWMYDDNAPPGVPSMTLYGTLFGAIDRQLAANAPLNVYVPAKYDLQVALNTLAIRFFINGNTSANCKKFCDNPNDAAAAAGCTVKSAQPLMISGPANVPLSVKGLGRIDGFFTTKKLFQTYNMQDVDGIYGYFNFQGKSNVAGIQWDVGVNQWSDLAVNIINANMLAIASQAIPANGGPQKNCRINSPKGGDFSPFVQGLQVAWAGRLGHSAIGLNSPFPATAGGGKEVAYGDNLDPSGTYAASGGAEGFCAGLYDVKSVGNWPDRADGIDVMGSRSAVTTFYLQANDDAIKVAVDNLSFKDTTVLQGFAGGAINVGSYGAMRTYPGKKLNIQGSSVKNTWIHRILQYGKGGTGLDGGDCAGSFGDGSGGLVVSRTCPYQGLGLQDFTIDTLEVPEIATVNRVGRLFALGANPQGYFCDSRCNAAAPGCCGLPANSASFPIKDLTFKYFTIYSQPQVSTCGRRAGSGGLTDPKKVPVEFFRRRRLRQVGRRQEEVRDLLRHEQQ